MLEQSNWLCGEYGLWIMPDFICGSLVPAGYPPLGAGYFLAASSLVIGVATMTPPTPTDPGLAVLAFAPGAALELGALLLPYPCPIAVLKLRAKQPTTAAKITAKYFFIVISILIRSYDIRRTCQAQIQKNLRSCAATRPAFSSLLSRYSFSKTRNPSRSILRSNPR